MIGTRYERLLVTAYLGIQKHRRLWECKCDCGAIMRVTTNALTTGNTKSCGCYKADLKRTHGAHKTRTYRIWQAMLNRCRQKQYAKYYSHLSVCERWKTSFEDFLEDMGHAPDGLSIDRINNSDGYFKENCRWATQSEQLRNTRRRKEYEMNGERRSLIEWADHLGVPHELIRGRIRRGWRFEDAARK